MWANPPVRHNGDEDIGGGQSKCYSVSVYSTTILKCFTQFNLDLFVPDSLTGISYKKYYILK